ncbi:MAG TPA: hypothetical protein VIV60_06950 [Polyangiaceae bacterium]
MRPKTQLGWFPSAGFFMLLASHSLLVVLLWWGWRTPRLDDAFELLSRRQLGGDVEYSPQDVDVLLGAWNAHPGLGRALVGKGPARFLEPTDSGWLTRPAAHLAVARPDPEHPTQIALESRGEPNDYPITVKLLGAGIERQLQLKSGDTQKVELSAKEMGKPGILNVELSPAQSRPTSAPSWAVRIVPSASSNVRDPHDQAL